MISAIAFALFQVFVTVAGSSPDNCPLILAHRGASGIYPEHTEVGYAKAASEGWADYIECDIQITKDLQLICSHHGWIKEVSDVEQHSEFKDRIASYNMDDDDPNFNWNDRGNITNNYFTFDFTLEELKTLTRKQVRQTRDPNYNWKYSFASFDEYVAIAKRYGVGIVPEIKSPSAVNKILKDRNVNRTVQGIVLDSLSVHNYTKATDMCIVQCFELSTIEYFKTRTGVRTMFLVNFPNKTSDDVLQMAKDSKAYAIGLNKELIVSTDQSGNIGDVNLDLIPKIHSLGMKVFAYTFRNELSSLKWDYQGDAHAEMEKFFELGLNGYFTDFPNTARSFLNTIEPCNKSSSIVTSITLMILVFNLKIIL